MKKISLLLVVAAAFAVLGCTSTMSVGPEANQSGKVVDADVSKNGISVSLPFVSAGIKVDEKKK